MSRVGIIGGTNADFDFEWYGDQRIGTPYGAVDIAEGRVSGANVSAAFVRRHGRGHERLSSMVEHRANITALAELGCAAIIATTVCGIVDPDVSLASAIVFDDLFFPDNRLPDGTACTFFAEEGQPGRGHYIFGSPFSPSLRAALIEAGMNEGIAVRGEATYAHMLGPRFNSRAEVGWLRGLGVTALSQTAGPEAVLAGELEIPYALVGFGVDYANGVRDEPTPVETLDANIAASEQVFGALVGGALRTLGETPFDSGFVYRF
ncbi:MAG: MTAP family purine nucleoside phosphorylase [Coriobacteriia bacterium]|nr:MTAP family purine nucleoside phosphorylase [Coriobacteriia bacterium]